MELGLSQEEKLAFYEDYFTINNGQAAYKVSDIEYFSIDEERNIENITMNGKDYQIHSDTAEIALDLHLSIFKAIAYHNNHKK